MPQTRKKQQTVPETVVDFGNESFPKSVTCYRKRIIRNGAELFKDPPVLPPTVDRLVVYTNIVPKRLRNGEYSFPDEKTFRPNMSPIDILLGGAFGGTYFRPIRSSVTDQMYNTEEVLEQTIPREWIERFSPALIRSHLGSETYDKSVNRYGVRCGGSLGMWESSGWISTIDPYGWFQWYCRFFNGRRSADDSRQIDRWNRSAGPNGRFRCQLCNQIIQKGASGDDDLISPVIRQNLLHWGTEIGNKQLAEYRKRKST